MTNKIITANLYFLNKQYVNNFEDETIKRFSNLVAKLKEARKSSGEDDFIYFVARAIHAMEASAIDQHTGEYNPKLGHIDKNDGTGKCKICGVELRKDDNGNYIDGMWCTSSKVLPYYNQNGDAFPEEELIKEIPDPESPDKKIKVYETFIGKGLFTDHQSNKVECLRGIILDAVYCNKTKGVDLLVALDKNQYPELARQVTIGYSYSVSMGCKVKYAVCGRCGNVSYTLNDLCSCIKPNGKKPRIASINNNSDPYQINYGIEFIELSIVSVGADPKAKVKRIFASINKNKAENDLIALAKKINFGGIDMKITAKLFSNKDKSKWVVYSGDSPVFEIKDNDVLGNKATHEERKFFASREYGEMLIKTIKSDGLDNFIKKASAAINKVAQATEKEVQNQTQTDDKKQDDQQISQTKEPKQTQDTQTQSVQTQDIQMKEEQVQNVQVDDDKTQDLQTKDTQTQDNQVDKKQDDVLFPDLLEEFTQKDDKKDSEKEKEELKELEKSDDISALKMAVNQIKDSIDNILKIIDRMNLDSDKDSGELSKVKEDLSDVSKSMGELIKEDESKLDKEAFEVYKNLLKYSIDYTSNLTKTAYDLLLNKKVVAEKSKKEKVNDKKVDDKKIDDNSGIRKLFHDDYETHKEILDMINNRTKPMRTLASTNKIEKLVEHKKELLLNDVNTVIKEYLEHVRDVDDYSEDKKIKKMFSDEFKTKEEIMKFLDDVLNKKSSGSIVKSSKDKGIDKTKKSKLHKKEKDITKKDDGKKEVKCEDTKEKDKKVSAVDEAMKRIFNDIKKENKDDVVKKFFDDAIKEFSKITDKDTDKNKVTMKEAYMLAYKRAELGMIPNTPEAIYEDMEDLVKLNKETFASLESIINRTMKTSLQTNSQCLMVGRQQNAMSGVEESLSEKLRKILS